MMWGKVKNVSAEKVKNALQILPKDANLCHDKEDEGE